MGLVFHEQDTAELQFGLKDPTHCCLSLYFQYKQVLKVKGNKSHNIYFQLKIILIIYFL